MSERTRSRMGKLLLCVLLVATLMVGCCLASPSRAITTSKLILPVTSCKEASDCPQDHGDGTMCVPDVYCAPSGLEACLPDNKCSDSLYDECMKSTQKCVKKQADDAHECHIWGGCQNCPTDGDGTGPWGQCRFSLDRMIANRRSTLRAQRLTPDFCQSEDDCAKGEYCYHLSCAEKEFRECTNDKECGTFKKCVELKEGKSICVLRHSYEDGSYHSNVNHNCEAKLCLDCPARHLLGVCQPGKPGVYKKK